MSDNNTLLKTPLFDLHQRLGAKMAPFAGYDMPIQYASGVLQEHLHTRKACGLFDVSHMGQIVVRAKSGQLTDAALALETLIPVDIAGLAEGRQRYGLLTNDAGGIRDDLMIANRGDHFLIVANAANKTDDLEHLKSHLAEACSIELLEDKALIALQGPVSEAVLAALAPDVSAMRFMDVRAVSISGVECVVARSGYTGEDGFEISIPANAAKGIADTLIADDRVEPIGLGARDSLRLEAGLCLHGSDIDPETTPIEANLNWAIQKVRRTGGARAGGFPGAEQIFSHLEQGTDRKRVGLQPGGRAPMRGGTLLFASDAGGDPIGHVTSGGFGPSVEGPVAMGYVATPHANIGAALFGEVRGKRMPVSVAKLPFITQTYKR